MSLPSRLGWLGFAALLLPLPAQSTRFVTVLHLCDTHANVFAGAPRDLAARPTYGGLARAAAIVERTRRQTDAVLTLHSGDFSIGDPTYNFFFGVPELQLLTAIGVDAMALGNHEFDLTPFTLLGALTQASTARPLCPLVAANLAFTAPAVQALQTFVQPFVVRDVGGLRIGVFGLTTPATAVLSQPDPVIVHGDVGTIAFQTVQALQQAGCDVVVLLSHLGLAADTALAVAVPGIHLILGGHDHYELRAPRTVAGPLGAPVTIVQNGGFYRQLGRMRIRWHKGAVTVRDHELIDLDATVAESGAVAAPLAALQQQVETLFPGMCSAQVAYANATFPEKALDLSAPGRHDTAMGNLLADVLRQTGDTQLAIAPCGSTAQPIHAGPVVPIDLFRAIGYGFNTTNGLGFRIATFRLPGIALLAGLEFTLGSLPDDSDFLVQVSAGFEYRYDPAQPPGQRLVGATLQGVPIDPVAIYTVTANEFMVAFLAQYLQLPVFDLQLTNVTEFEALLQHAMASGTLTPNVVTPRVVAVGGA